MTDEDRFDIALRRLVAEEKLVELAREIAETLDLNPACVWAVEDAIQERDIAAIVEASIDFLEAMEAAAS